MRIAVSGSVASIVEVEVVLVEDVLVLLVVAVVLVLVVSAVLVVGAAALVVEVAAVVVSGGVVCSTGSLPPHPQRTSKQMRNVCLMRIDLKIHDPCDSCQKTVAGLRRGRVKVWVFRINW